MVEIWFHFWQLFPTTVYFSKYWIRSNWCNILTYPSIYHYIERRTSREMYLPFPGWMPSIRASINFAVHEANGRTLMIADVYVAENMFQLILTFQQMIIWNTYENQLILSRWIIYSIRQPMKNNFQTSEAYILLHRKIILRIKNSFDNIFHWQGALFHVKTVFFLPLVVRLSNDTFVFLRSGDVFFLFFPVRSD